MSLQTVPQQFLLTCDTISNQGTKNVNKDSPSGEYYGFLSEIVDVGNGNYSILFEIVRFEWMEANVLSIKGSICRNPLLSPVSFLKLDDASLDVIAKALGTTAEKVREGNWYIIDLIKKTIINSRKGFQTAKRTNDYDEESIYYIGEPVSEIKEEKLREKCKLSGKFEYDTVQKDLRKFQPCAIGVMDVGTASCNLVYDETGNPLVYVDLGLPIGINRNTMPPTIVDPGPCLNNDPMVILTHWHFDHFSMARDQTGSLLWCGSNNWNELLKLHWVVPEQDVGLAVCNLFIMLQEVDLWPVDHPNLVAGCFNIIKCNGAPGNMNNSGLAVNVSIKAADSTTKTQVLSVLLPGDAQHQFIPNVATIPRLQWMVVPHHGSDTDLIAGQLPRPVEANKGRIAYSYGIRPGGEHVYKHPRQTAINAYHAAGWGAEPNMESATAEESVTGVTPKDATDTAANVTDHTDPAVDATVPAAANIGRGNILMCSNNLPTNVCGINGCPFHDFPKHLI